MERGVGEAGGAEIGVVEEGGMGVEDAGDEEGVRGVDCAAEAEGRVDPEKEGRLAEAREELEMGMGVGMEIYIVIACRRVLLARLFAANTQQKQRQEPRSLACGRCFDDDVGGWWAVVRWRRNKHSLNPSATAQPLASKTAPGFQRQDPPCSRRFDGALGMRNASLGNLITMPHCPNPCPLV